MKDLVYPYIQKARLTLGFNVMYGTIRHAGYDFGTADFSHDNNPNNDAILCMDKGLCIASALAKDGTGEYVIMYYQNLDISVNYWHLGKRVAVVGKWYNRGEIIAYVGHSGKWAEHTHIGFKKGRRLGSLWEEGYTINPQPYFNRMELWSNLIEDPVKIAELEKTIKDMQAKQAASDIKQVASDKKIVELQSQITVLNTSVNTLNGQLHDMNTDVLKWKSIAIDIASMVGYVLDPVSDWGTQRYGVREKIALLPYTLSITALLGIIINKIKGKTK